MPFSRRLIATIVAASLALSTLPLYAQPSAQGDHARLQSTQDGAYLAERLRERGVSAGELRLRIAALGGLRHR